MKTTAAPPREHWVPDRVRSAPTRRRRLLPGREPRSVDMPVQAPERGRVRDEGSTGERAPGGGVDVDGGSIGRVGGHHPPRRRSPVRDGRQLHPDERGPLPACSHRGFVGLVAATGDRTAGADGHGVRLQVRGRHQAGHRDADRPNRAAVGEIDGPWRAGAPRPPAFRIVPRSTTTTATPPPLAPGQGALAWEVIGKVTIEGRGWRGAGWGRSRSRDISRRHPQVVGDGRDPSSQAPMRAATAAPAKVTTSPRRTIQQGVRLTLLHQPETPAHEDGALAPWHDRDRETDAGSRLPGHRVDAACPGSLEHTDGRHGRMDRARHRSRAPPRWRRRPR